MPTEEAEREARATGDISRGRLAPLSGALLGAGVALAISVETTPARIAAFARETYTWVGDPIVALRAVLAVIVACTLPLLVGALAGALLAGLLQTRGYFGRGALAALPERGVPNPVLALFGWAALALLLFDLVRVAVGLAAPASPDALARAGLAVARDLVRAFFVGTVALAIVDHLVRARARRARLDDAEPVRARRRAQSAEDALPSVEALLHGVDTILFDGDVAVTFGSREGARWAYARARGLSARALLEAARRRRLVVRAVRSAAPLEALLLGAPVSPTQATELELPRRGSA